MGCLYKRISETKKRSTRAREGKLDSVVQGVNTLSPNDGIDVISGACTNVVNGVIPDVRISVAPGLSPGRKTDGSSEVILAQIPSAQSNTQVTIMIPAPEGVESHRPPGPELRPPRPGRTSLVRGGRASSASAPSGADEPRPPRPGRTGRTSLVRPDQSLVRPVRGGRESGPGGPETHGIGIIPYVWNNGANGVNPGITPA